MNFGELFIIATALSMDAFAIAICKGLSTQKLEKKHYIITGLWFGGAQAIMPLIGSEQPVRGLSKALTIGFHL